MAPTDAPTDAQSPREPLQAPSARADPTMAPWMSDAHNTPSLHAPALAPVIPQPYSAISEAEIGAPSHRYTLPSSRASKRRADDSASSSPTKRSRTSRKSSSTTFASGVKTKLEVMYGDRCWHCRAARQNQTAHMFAKADETFAICQAMGLVDLEHLGQAENALSLCPLCHGALDKDNVLLIIVPYDLEYFVNVERSWQRTVPQQRRRRPKLKDAYTLHCTNEYSTEYVQCRADHGSFLDGGLYRCYMVVDFFPVYNASLRRPHLECTRIWHGDPKAAIRRALKQINSIPVVPAHLVDVKAQLLNLGAEYDKGNLLYETFDLPPADIFRDNDNDSARLPCPGFPGLPGLPPSSASVHPPLNTNSTNPAPQHRQQSSSGGYNQRMRSADSPAPQHPIVEMASPINRKRKRVSEDSPRLPSPSLTDGKTEEQEEATQKKRRLHMPLSPGAVVHPQHRTQRAQLWQWGGPDATAAENMRYYTEVFGLKRNVG